MKHGLLFACVLVCGGIAHAQPSGPTAAAYQTALSKCSAGSASNAQAFDACMKVQGFSAPMVPTPSVVGAPPPQMTIQPYPMPVPPPPAGMVPGSAAPVTPVPAEPLARAPKTIETECRVANGEGKFYEACLKSNGLKDAPPGNTRSPLAPPVDLSRPAEALPPPPVFTTSPVPPQ